MLTGFGSPPAVNPVGFALAALGDGARGPSSWRYRGWSPNSGGEFSWPLSQTSPSEGRQLQRHARQLNVTAQIAIRPERPQGEGQRTRLSRRQPQKWFRARCGLEALFAVEPCRICLGHPVGSGIRNHLRQHRQCTRRRYVEEGGRTNTCGRRRRAALVFGSPSKPSMALSKPPTPAGAVIAGRWTGWGAMSAPRRSAATSRSARAVAMA